MARFRTVLRNEVGSRNEVPLDFGCWVKRKYILNSHLPVLCFLPASCFVVGFGVATRELTVPHAARVPFSGRHSQGRWESEKKGHIRGETGREPPSLLSARGVVSGLCHPQCHWRPSQLVPKADTDTVSHPGNRGTQGGKPARGHTNRTRQSQVLGLSHKTALWLGSRRGGSGQTDSCTGWWEAASTEELCLVSRGCGASTTR